MDLKMYKLCAILGKLKNSQQNSFSVLIQMKNPSYEKLLQGVRYARFSQ